MGVGMTVSAQEVPPAAPAQVQTVPGMPAAPAVSPSPAQRRRDVKIMEGILANAVKAGAEDLSRRMQIAEPGSLFVTGTARARGIALDGYGVFFDVDVPMMRQSVLWTTRQLIEQDFRTKLQQFIATAPNPEARRLAEQRLRALNAQSPPPQNNAGSITPVANGTTVDTAAPPPPGRVEGATVDAPGPVVPTMDPRDPNEMYTDAVKMALIEAMLNYSGALRLGDTESLTVAARDSEGSLTPGAIDDSSTIVLTINGRDLNAFRSGKLSREELLKRVAVRDQ
jgi:hypothetical protein